MVTWANTQIIKRAKAHTFVKNHSKMYLAHWNQPDEVLLFLVVVNNPFLTYLTRFCKQKSHFSRSRLFVNYEKAAQTS
jgi:hypothetical protein